MIFEYEILVREQHLDSYGHVNNAMYLALYEEARWEAITQRGYGFHKVHETGLGPIVLDINLKFFKEIKLREKIKITLEVISYEGKLCKLRQHMIKENKTVASEALITIAFFDLKNRKLILPNDEWLSAIDFRS